MPYELQQADKAGGTESALGELIGTAGMIHALGGFGGANAATPETTGAMNSIKNAGVKSQFFENSNASICRLSTRDLLAMPGTRISIPTQTRTPLGLAMENFSAQLFRNRAPVQRNTETMAQRELRDAQTEHYRAQTGEIDRKAGAAIMDESRRAGAPLEVLTSIFGTKPTAERFQQYRNTGSWGEPVPDLSLADPTADTAEMQPNLPKIAATAPAEVTPERQRQANNMLQALALAAAWHRQSTADNIALASRDIDRTDFTIAPRLAECHPDAIFRRTQAEYANRGGAPFGGNSDVTRNLVTGATNNTAIGNERIPLLQGRPIRRTRQPTQAAPCSASAIWKRAPASASVRLCWSTIQNRSYLHVAPAQQSGARGLPTVSSRRRPARP